MTTGGSMQLMRYTTKNRKGFMMKKLLHFSLISVSTILAGCASAPAFHEDNDSNPSDQTRADMSQPKGATTHAIGAPSQFSGAMVSSQTQHNGQKPSKDMIFFGFDRYQLSGTSPLAKQGQMTANHLANYLIQHPTAQIVLAGYTDPQGSESYNLHLGQKRATSVYNYLKSQGVNPQQMCTVSFGESRPASLSAFAGNKTKAYAHDRRVQIEYHATCEK